MPPISSIIEVPCPILSKYRTESKVNEYLQLSSIKSDSLQLKLLDFLLDLICRDGKCDCTNTAKSIAYSFPAALKTP